MSTHTAACTRVLSHRLTPMVCCCRAYIFKVWKEEGFGAIYRGYIAKVSRLGPGGGVMIMVVDVVNGLLNRMFG